MAEMATSRVDRQTVAELERVTAGLEAQASPRRYSAPSSGSGMAPIHTAIAPGER